MLQNTPLVMAAGDDVDVAANFKYEVSTHSSALFEPHGISSAKCKSVVSAFGPWTCVKQNVPRNNWDFLQ